MSVGSLMRTEFCEFFLGSQGELFTSILVTSRLWKEVEDEGLRLLDLGIGNFASHCKPGSFRLAVGGPSLHDADESAMRSTLSPKTSQSC